ncbi:TPA: AcrB/AcrD/AcrF family protein, partial [Candidatus Sumerlaeota bacterium]|nr:AcrB/AcrD/AcrF family protein [Candidatus Sumerlaeota bacterium]
MHVLAAICVKRPVFASVLVLIFVVFGVFGYLQLGVDRFPKTDFPIITVTTQLTGSAPEEVETEITDKIEEAVNTVSGIDELRSVSSEGVSQVFITFQLEKDVDVAAQEVRDKVNRVLPDLPQDVKQPTIEKMDPDASPILSIAVSAPDTVKNISEYADKVLRRRLESTAGVGQVMLVGAQKRQINVQLDPPKLRALNLTIADVARALAAQNIQVPGGTVKTGASEYTLRTMGRVMSMQEMAAIAIDNRNGHTITIADVGSVEDGTEEITSLSLFDDTPALLLNVRKQSGTNTVAVANSVKERLATILETAPKGYKIQVVRDQSLFIKASVDTVKEHLVIGALFAAIIVFCFLSNIRTTFIAALAIPTSIISAFAVMQMMGFTLNMMTLLALTLSVGIVIDDAIVVLENIYRYIEEKDYSPYDAAIAATREIGLAVLSITLSLVAVFMPIAFMAGIVGRFMKPFGLTMVSAIVVSMLVSFTLTPMLAARFLRRAGQKSKTNGKESEEADGGLDPNSPPHMDNVLALATSEVHSLDEYKNEHAHSGSKKRGFYHMVEQIYLAMLTFSLRHRWVIVLIAVGLIATIPTTFRHVRKNFIPDDDQSEFQISVRTPEGTSIEATQVILARIAREVRTINGIKYTIASVADSDQHTANDGNIYVRMVEMDQRKFGELEMMNFVRKEVIPKFASEHLRTSVTPIASISGGGMSSADVQYMVGGPDMKKLELYSGKIMEKLRTLPDATDVDSSLITGKPQYGVTVDRAKAADLGVSIKDVSNTLRLLVAGDKVSDYNEKGEQYEVHVRAASQYRNSIDELKMVTVPSTKLGTVSLGDVVRFDKGDGPSQINRLNRDRQVTISTNLTPGASQQTVIDLMEKTVEEMKMDPELKMGPEYKTALMGKSKEMMKAARSFAMVFILAFLFVYLVIAAQFESWIHPITILLCLPLTLPFALVSLL